MEWMTAEQAATHDDEFFWTEVSAYYDQRWMIGAVQLLDGRVAIKMPGQYLIAQPQERVWYRPKSV